MAFYWLSTRLIWFPVITGFIISCSCGMYVDPALGYRLLCRKIEQADIGDCSVYWLPSYAFTIRANDWVALTFALDVTGKKF